MWYNPKVVYSCDLLEKSYLCGINNNLDKKISILPFVVICLKSLTFVVSITTSSVGMVEAIKL